MLSPIVPEGGEQKQDWMRFAPFGDDFSLLILVRRFHSLRSFHQRLFTFAPFGDGRHKGLLNFLKFEDRRLSHEKVL